MLWSLGLNTNGAEKVRDQLRSASAARTDGVLCGCLILPSAGLCASGGGNAHSGKVVIKPDWKKSLFIPVICLGVIISVVAVLLRVVL